MSMPKTYSAHIFELGCMDQRVYLQDEADKTFEELQADYREACDRLQTANLIKDEKLAEARHETYKRCMAKAEACMHKRWRTDEGFDYARSTRHMNKWLELAEKFKEAK